MSNSFLEYFGSGVDRPHRTRIICDSHLLRWENKSNSITTRQWLTKFLSQSQERNCSFRYSSWVALSAERWVPVTSVSILICPHACSLDIHIARKFLYVNIPIFIWLFPDFPVESKHLDGVSQSFKPAFFCNLHVYFWKLWWLYCEPEAAPSTRSSKELKTNTGSRTQSSVLSAESQMYALLKVPYLGVRLWL